ncbi:MAG: gas vesicle protein K [Dehalococcoidia bacterium]|nr:gas vesicle protein K [Dehalococcoidia bacterium]
MAINIEEKDLKHGLLGLVIALVEIIKEALNLEAMRRMEGGSLTEAQIERLGEALMDLDVAIGQIKEEQGLAESVKAVRDGLDDVVDEVLEKFLNPVRWMEGENGNGHKGS